MKRILCGKCEICGKSVPANLIPVGKGAQFAGERRTSLTSHLGNDEKSQCDGVGSQAVTISTKPEQ